MDGRMVWAIVICAAVGALGGFASRIGLNGLKKEQVANAPPEVGVLAAMFLGAIAAVGVLLATESVSPMPVMAADLATYKPPSTTTAFVLTWNNVVGSFAAGLTGIGWLLSIQNSQTWAAALGEAASKPASAGTAAASTATPRRALRTVRRQPG